MKLIQSRLDAAAPSWGGIIIFAIISSAAIYSWFGSNEKISLPSGAWVLSLGFVIFLEWLRGWWRDSPEILGWRWFLRCLSITIALTIIQIGWSQIPGACTESEQSATSAFCTHSKKMLDLQPVAQTSEPIQKTPPASSIPNTSTQQISSSPTTSATNKDSPGVTEIITTALGVVIAVVTLVATKTANDAKVEVTQARELLNQSRENLEIYQGTAVRLGSINLLSMQQSAIEKQKITRSPEVCANYETIGKCMMQSFYLLDSIQNWGTSIYTPKKTIDFANFLFQTITTADIRTIFKEEREWLETLKATGRQALNDLELRRKHHTGHLSASDSQAWEDARKTWQLVVRL